MSEDLNLTQALRLLSQEKNIDEFLMLEKLEQSLAATYQRILDLDNPVRVTIDRESGKIYVYELVPVGEWDEEAGDEPVYEERDVTPADVSRIAAQAAKNVIGSIIRDAERERIFDEYADRVGESVTGTVQQSDSRYTLIKIREGVEALLPPSEQPSNERYDHNQRIKAYIIDVRKTSNEPSIVVSRTHPGLIRRLFEIEVPEVYDGIVEIKSRGPRAGYAQQGRRLQPRERSGSRGRVRRPQGQPRAHDRERAARRAHRRGAVVRGPRQLRGARPVAGQGRPRAHRRGGAHRHRHRS